nr:putative retrotransposon protein [Tanacetum cinerariifolium]
MMSLTTLPLSFWDYALETAARILNIVPTKKVDKTPYELWHGKVPNLSDLKKLVDLPPGAKVVKSKWIYKKKTDMDGVASGSNVIFLILYVDDITLMGNHKPSLQEVKDYLELQVKCYYDAGFETNRDDTKSQTRYVFTMNGGAIVWKSSKQSTTAQHATKAEYIAATEAAKEAVWIRKFVDELGLVPSNNYPIEMNCDNTAAAIYMAKKPGIMKGATHSQRKFHYVCECVETGEI